MTPTLNNSALLTMVPFDSACPTHCQAPARLSTAGSSTRSPVSRITHASVTLPDVSRL